MNKLALIALTASALTLSATALAQARQAGPRGPSGHSFSHAGRGNVVVRHHGGASAVARSHSNAVSRSRSNAISRSRSNAVVRHGGSNVVVRHGGSNVTVRHRGGRHVRHPGRHFRHGRLQRGFFIHPFWFGPQFHVQNWQTYGFNAPAPDQRWVRYYDDAYLIDREGRVQDTRYGLDWDEYGERWDSDEGIPHYYGRGDYRPDERDYAWVESQEGRGYAAGPGFDGYGDGAYAEEGYAEDHYADEGYAGEGYADERYEGSAHAYGQVAPAPLCRPVPPAPCGGYGPPAHHGYGYGYGYGAGYGGGHGYYGWGVAYPMVIETTVVTGGTSSVEEVTEEVVEVRQAQRRHRRPPVRQRPRPPAGERG